LSFARNGIRLDAADIVDLFGEVAITERALLDGTVLEGNITTALLVENLGPYRDITPPAGWLVVHSPGWDTATIGLLLEQLHAVRIIHFGDLDPNGVRIVRHLQQMRSDLVWAVPGFWCEYVEKKALLGEWPNDLQLADAPELVRDLARRGLWLEQETITLDPRLGGALEALAQ
jgi:hypothetical protein